MASPAPSNVARTQTRSVTADNDQVEVLKLTAMPYHHTKSSDPACTYRADNKATKVAQQKAVSTKAKAPHAVKRKRGEDAPIDATDQQHCVKRQNVSSKQTDTVKASHTAASKVTRSRKPKVKNTTTSRPPWRP